MTTERKPHPHDVVDPEYRGNLNHLGIYELRDPKKNRKTHPLNQTAEGVDFDVFNTRGEYDN